MSDQLMAFVILLGGAVVTILAVLIYLGLDTLLVPANRTAAAAPINAPIAAPMRIKLPPRRRSVRESIEFEFSGKTTRRFEVTFGFNENYEIKEVFCAGAHTQSDLQAIVEDGCVALSRALQFGDRIADQAKALGELRDEGAQHGPPSSPLGAIMRAGAALEAEVRGQVGT